MTPIIPRLISTAKVEPPKTTTSRFGDDGFDRMCWVCHQTMEPVGNGTYRCKQEGLAWHVKAESHMDFYD